MAVERCRVFYRGRVQGVGFRYTTQQIARGFAVAGTVRNLDDGRVEVVAEGEADELTAFLDEVATSLRPYIRGADVERWPSDGATLSGFSIIA